MAPSAVVLAADESAQFSVAFDAWFVAMVSAALLAVAFGVLGAVRLRRQLATCTQALEHANVARRESESRLRILLQALPDPVWLKDPGGRFLLCNRRVEEAYGAPAAEIIGKTDYDFVEHQVADVYRAHDRAVITSGQASTNEDSVVFAKDGHRALLQTIKTPVYDAQGQMIGVLGIARDITELKQAEEAKNSLLRRLELATEAAEIGIWVWDLSNNALQWDQRMRELYQAPVDDSGASLSYALWRSRCHPEDRARAEQELAAATRGEHDYSSHFRILRPDGSIRHLQAAAIIERDASGAPVRFVGINRDITASKQAGRELEQHRNHLQDLVEARTHALTTERQRLANILEGTRAGTWEWNIQSGQVRINERWAEIIGYRLEELAPVDFNTWLRHVHPDDWRQAKTLLERHLERTLDYYECEARMRHRDGHWVWVLVRGKLVCRDANNQPLWIAGTHIDITPLKDVEQALIQAKEQAEQAVLDKSRFLANMSHEIRTPMNAIMGLAYLLERQHLPKEAQDLARKIHRSGQSLLAIINDILDLSKIESGKIDLEQVPFQITTVLDNLATIMSATAASKALELVIVPPPCSDWPLLGDPLRLGQILINLTSNAIKFTESGLVEVRIEPRQTSATEVWLRFAVKDTGIGIAEATKARLFEPFTQADASTTRHFGGSGLGLTISRRLIELMGGSIDLISRVGEGSTFWFDLPFERLSQDALTVRPSVPIHVLVVEAEPSVREGLLATVAALGWSGRATDSGEAMLAQLLQDETLQGPEAVVLLDWQLLQADAHATAQAIHAALPATRWPLLMAMTAAPVDQIEDDLNTSRIEAVLSKPLTPSPLYNAVVRARSRRLGKPVAEESLVRQTRRLVGLRLLVVDDSEINREVAYRILADEGARVNLANDGQQALDWLLAHPQGIDLVLMDVQMPVMDGHEATRRMRQNAQLAHLPVIALTAGAMRTQEVAAEQAGMNAYLSKPFDVEEAITMILHLTHGRTQHPVAKTPASVPAPADVGASDANFPGLTLERALGIWKDAAVYRRYLRKFSQEYRDAVTRIRAATPEQARRVAHKLKGAAGNLGLDEVARCAARLEQLGATADATEQQTTAITDLQNALDTALASIAAYTAEPVAVAPEATTRAHDQPDLAPLIRAAYSAFRDFDPIGAEEPLSELAHHLPAQRLAAIQDAIEALDAAAGDAAVRTLANHLHIDLEDAT
ncbi:MULTISPECIES: PAS domain-containing protein [Thiorhodovibrio]|uniref:PAS domain-containing protein n=1 Tax=Thiorhodovibrio TaxID=61593 RepID=UPI001913786B|nr:MULTISPECIES: PAS domain-containing protein [Thiorhodovibrio]